MLICGHESLHRKNFLLKFILKIMVVVGQHGTWRILWEFLWLLWEFLWLISITIKKLISTTIKYKICLINFTMHIVKLINHILYFLVVDINFFIVIDINQRNSHNNQRNSHKILQVPCCPKLITKHDKICSEFCGKI